MEAWTRFCPTLSGYAHAGSWYTAYLNWAWGEDAGIILRHEDMTAMHTVGHATTASMVEFAADFSEQFRACGIPIARECWQSEFKTQCEEINQQRFGGALSWDITGWRARCRHWGVPYANFAGESPLMAQLTRVYCDRVDRVKYVIRGTELAAEKEAYWVMWHLAFPETPVGERPFLWFVPEVMQPDGHKISKSNPHSINYVLKDVQPNPAKMAMCLFQAHFEPTDHSGVIEDYAGSSVQETLLALRGYVRNARIRPVPDPITLDMVRKWS